MFVFMPEIDGQHIFALPNFVSMRARPSGRNKCCLE